MADFETMPAEAHALIPYRFVNGGEDAVEYEGTTFPRDPYKGCYVVWNRCRRYQGEIDPETAYGMVDVVDSQGDILGTFLIRDLDRWRYLMDQLGRPKRTWAEREVAAGDSTDG